MSAAAHHVTGAATRALNGKPTFNYWEWES